MVGGHFAVQRRASRASVDGTTDMRADGHEDASSRRFRERAVAGRCEKRRFRLLQDAADALRWSARGKDEEERRLTRDAIAALSHRLAFVLALVLPPLVALVADGAATRALLREWGFETVTRFPEYAADPSWRLAVLLLGVERACYTIMWTAPAVVSRACRVVSRGAWTPVDLTVALFANKILQATAFFAIGTSPRTIPTRFEPTMATFARARSPDSPSAYPSCSRDKYSTPPRTPPSQTGYTTDAGSKARPAAHRSPLTVVSHPRHAGATMTAWGTCALLANRTVVRRGWFGIAAAQSVLPLHVPGEATLRPKC